MQEVTLFIPRILPTVSKKKLANQFLGEKIGYCSNIKSKYRINANGFEYWFAFITIQFFDTPNARMFYQKVVNEEKVLSMEYFDDVLKKPRHWDISLRNLEKKNTKEPEPEPVLEEGEICETCFGEEEHKEIYEDYLEIEQEIFGYRQEIFGYRYNIHGLIM